MGFFSRGIKWNLKLCLCKKVQQTTAGMFKKVIKSSSVPLERDGSK